jgi:hypothetical protein
MDAEEKIEWSQAFLDGRFVPAKKGETGLEKPRWAGNQGYDGIGWKRGADRSVSGQRPPS